MNPELAYLDSSALVKLVLREPETDALRAALRARPQSVSSVLARVEVPRAVARAGAGAIERRRAEAVLASIGLIRLDEDVLRMAATIRPLELRSLDALHLATALSARSDIGMMFAYDRRLVNAARAAGLMASSPR